jgi:TonB-linked SusC/RagA family outer membrane protein
MKKYIAFVLFCLCFSVYASAQITVKGVVSEPSGETCIGASVIEKGHPTAGSVTDVNGRFSLKVSSRNATIVVSYVGMKSQEIKLNGRTNLNVKLQSDEKSLDEVVIVGYGVQKKINATGAVKTIDSKVLESRPVTTAVQGLQGAIGGLNITNDNGGGLGTEMQINIRGVGSIGDGSNASPLVLIDGMEGDLSTINPNDIANISVLKDAAAASIYGSRAPFGVILVTTKSGEKGFRLTYSDNLRVSQPVKVPDMVDGYTFALMMNDAYINSGGSAPFGSSQLSRIQAYMNGEISYATEPWENDPNRWKQNQACFGNTDWYDVYLKKATFSQEHNVSLTGGGDKVTYYLSANYLNQNGLFNYADERYRRLGLTGKVNVKFNDYVSLRWDTRMINIDNDKPSALNALFYHNLGRRAAVAPLYMPNGEYSQDSMVEAMLHGGRTDQKTQQLYNQASLLIEPIKGWQIHADVSSRIEHNPYTRQFKPITHSLPDGTQEYMLVLEGITDKHTINSDGTFTVQPAAGESYYEKATTSVNYFSTNVYTDYTLNLKGHQFKFLVGEQSEYYHTGTDRMASTNILLSETPFLPSEIGGKSTMISEKKGEWSSLGFFGRMNYNYSDRYMAELNIRADGASRFPTDGRWAAFPSSRQVGTSRRNASGANGPMQ